MIYKSMKILTLKMKALLKKSGKINLKIFKIIYLNKIKKHLMY